MSFILPLAVLVALLILASRTFGPRGTGLPPSQTILDLAGWSIPLLSSSLALGFVVMAIIQLFKPEVRAAFHAGEIGRWLGRGSYRGIADEFVYLVSPRAHDALLELPIEQLAAQIQAASDAAFADTFGSQSPMHQERGAHLIQLLLGDDYRYPPQMPDDPRYRAGVAYLVQRRLDDLQIQVRQQWRRVLRVMSLFISLVLTVFVASVFGLWRQNPIGTAFLVLLFSLLGAFFASAARDFIAVFERLRN